MVEEESSSSSFMRALLDSRATAASPFGSCKEGWYFRCLGPDPQSRKKKNQNNVKGANRLLISINVLGSAGPIRFIVSEEQLVANVIDTTLKSYAREGRLPVLGSDLHDFQLYCPFAGPDALSPWDTIGSHGARNFTLCKKPQPEKVAEDGKSQAEPIIHRKGTGGWRSWINKSLNLKIYSH